MTKTNKRSYLFALVDGGGTVPVELGAVERLVARGHDVTVLAEDSMADDVAATGARMIPWRRATNRASRRREDDPYRDWECKTPATLVARLLETQFVGPAPDYAADALDAIERHRPDLVVCSMFAVGAMIGAESAGVPFDVLFANCYVLPAPGMPPFGLGLRPARGPIGRLRDRVLEAVSTRWWNKGTRPLNELRTSLGLEPVDAIFDQIARARRVLVLTSADFDFPAVLPDNVRYVGPVLDDPSWARHDEDLPAGDEPLVLVGLSSTFQDQIATLERIIAGLATLPVRAVVTTGPAVDPADVAAPDRIRVVRSTSHANVLRQAAAVVTHGGHGTVARSLAAGVPMVVMHHGRDQADNAARVTSRGAGLSISRRAKPAAIAKAVARVLDDEAFRQRAEALGASLRRDAESGRLVAELESIEGRAASPAPVASGS